MQKWHAVLSGLVGMKGLALSGLIVMLLWSAPTSRLSSTAHREPPLDRGMKGDRPGTLKPSIPQETGLTAGAEGRVRAILAAHQATFRTLCSQLREDYEALIEEICASEIAPDSHATHQVQWIVQSAEELIQVGFKVELEVRQVLPPEPLAGEARLNDWGLALHAEMRSLCTAVP